MITERIVVAFALTLCLALAVLTLRIVMAAERRPSRLGAASAAAAVGARSPIEDRTGK